MFDGLIYNVSYEIAGSLILCAVLFVLYSVYTHRNRINRTFKYFVWFELITEILDIITAFTISYASSIPPWINYVLINLYNICGTIAEAFILQYLLASVHKKSRPIYIITLVIISVYFALIIATPFTGVIFSMENGKYVHGPLYVSTYVVLFAFIIELIVIVSINWKKFKTYQKVANIFFLFAELVAALLQMFVVPNTLLTLFGGSISTLLILFSLESPYYVELAYLRKNLETEVTNKTIELELRRKQLEELTSQTLESLGRAIDATDKYTNGHSIRVAIYSRLIGSQLGLSREKLIAISYAALLHDIGKVGIDSAILKKKGKLTPEEFDIIKSHTTIGSKILSGIKIIPEIGFGAHWHHERYDGKGYPDGLKGEDIPLIARIICVADCYDAMSSSRSYRGMLSQDYIRNEFVKGRGTQFDPRIADIMINIIDNDKDYALKEGDEASVEKAAEYIQMQKIEPSND